MNDVYKDKYFFKYSTPSIYIDSIKNKGIAWPSKTDDMFPYSDNPPHFGPVYWTGYYSSRALTKEYIRRASHNLHTTTNLYAEKMLDQEISEN